MSTRKLFSLSLAAALVTAPFAATTFAATSTATTPHHTTHHPMAHTTRTHGTTTASRSRNSGDAAVDALNAQSLARARGGQAAPATSAPAAQ